MEAATMPKQAIDTGRRLERPFSEGIRAGNLIFVSGKAGRNPKTGQFGDVQDQTRWALRAIEQVLQAAGATMDNVVKVTVFLKEGTDWNAMNEEYAGHFRAPLPARSSLFCSGLANPEMLLEIEAIAVLW